MKTNAGIRPQTGQVWVCRDGRTLEPDFLVAGDIGGVSAGLVPFGGATGGLATAAGFSFNSGTNALAAPGAVAAVGAISTTDTTASSSTTTGSGKFAGGVGVVGNVWVGGTLNVAGTSTLAAVDATSIGATTPGTGAFTTLSASSAITYDSGSGANPATALSNTAVTLLAADSAFARLVGVSFGSNGLVLSGRGVGGTRASPAATAANQVLCQFTGFGYDGSTYPSASAALYSLVAGSLWSGTNRETYHEWRTTSSGSTTNTQRMILFGSGNLSLGTNPTDDGSHLLQVAGSVAITGVVAFTSGTAISSTTTGTVVVTGGAGISGDTYIGGLLNVVGTITSTGRHNISLTDANTSTASNLMVVDHASSGTPAAGFGSQLLVRASSSTTASRNQGLLLCEWATATDASRAGRLSLWAYDSGGPREGIRIEASGTAPMLGVLGSSAVVKQTVTGSRGANAALASLITAMAAFGFVTDSST